MKRFYVSALTFGLVFSGTVACAAAEVAPAPAQAKAPTTVPAPTQTVPLIETYTNSEKNYSISYPENWKKTDVPRLDLVLFAPPKGSDSNSHASMNIVSEVVGPGVTLDQFYSESASNLTSALKDVQVEKTGNTPLNGVPTKWLLYKHVMQDIKFRVMQYFIVVGGTVYLLTFSSVADSFDNYRPEFDSIANSFKIIKPVATTQPAK